LEINDLSGRLQSLRKRGVLALRLRPRN